MAVFIVHEYYDHSGEGARQDLLEFPSQDAAHQKMTELRSSDDIISAKMIIGNITEEFDAEGLMCDGCGFNKANCLQRAGCSNNLAVV